MTYHIEIEQVSPFRYLIARVYHWYDMRVPLRVPGWGRVEALLRRFGAENRTFQIEGDEETERWRDRPLGWTTRQDLRCYELGRAKRTTLATLEVSEAQYLKLGGTIRKTISLPAKP